MSTHREIREIIQRLIRNDLGAETKALVEALKPKDRGVVMTAARSLNIEKRLVELLAAPPLKPVSP